MDVDLMVMQERCRKDPLSYKEDFLSQRRHFDALLSAAILRPCDASPRLAEVAAFMGSVAHCYGEEGAAIAPAIAEFLSESGIAMHPNLRRALVKLLGLLRGRNSADPKVIIPLFFRLLACSDKSLRRMLHGHIIADVKKIQASGHVSRKALQTYLFSMVSDPNEVLVKRSLHVLVDLFRKKVWNDAKCANMIAFACLHQSMSVATIAAKFILDSESKEQQPDSDEDESNEGVEAGRSSRDGQKAADMWKLYNLTGKKSSKKKKRMERVINRLTKVKRNETSSTVSGVKPGHPALEAMMLINDPQDFAERLFSDLQTRRKKESFENRLVFINLISRLVGTHELILFNLYPFLQRYLQPAQPEVTRVLAYLTQACHDKVPPDVLHPILRGLADSFVSERSSPPSMAAGINTIRAICSRVPLAILDDDNECRPEDDQEAPLLLDLVQYKTFKDKGVMMAARSLVGLYREVHPGLLLKKDRGRSGAVAVQKGEAAQVKAYGEHRFESGVAGVELLSRRESERASESDSHSDSEEDQSREAAICTGSGEEDSDAVESKEDPSAPQDQLESIAGCDEEIADKDGYREENARFDAMQILTDEDFAKIRVQQMAKAMRQSGIVTNTGEAVDPDEIQGPLKRQRRTLEERLESVRHGREGREKFGSRKGIDKGGGSSNKQKLKTKSNAMVIHKRRRKSKQLSRRDKQIAMRKKKDYK